MAGKLVVVVGRRPQFYTIWVPIVVPEWPHETVLASPQNKEPKRARQSGNVVYDLVSEVHTLYIQWNIMQPSRGRKSCHF